MFEYLKDYCNQKIDKLNNEYLEEKNKIELIKNDKMVISTFKNYRHIHKGDIFGLSVCALMLIAFSGVAILNPDALIFAIGLIPINIMEIIDFKKTKKI